MKTEVDDGILQLSKMTHTLLSTNGETSTVGYVCNHNMSSNMDGPLVKVTSAKGLLFSCFLLFDYTVPFSYTILLMRESFPAILARIFSKHVYIHTI